MGSMTRDRVSEIAAGTMASAGVPGIFTQDTRRLNDDDDKEARLKAVFADVSAHSSKAALNQQIEALDAFRSTLQQSTKITREGLEEIKALTAKLNETPTLWGKIRSRAKSFIS